tara:strand:+ start:184 stop:465 length:282 start_codon:yes stop_codon:yes gene_type:complete
MNEESIFARAVSYAESLKGRYPLLAGNAPDITVEDLVADIKRGVAVTEIAKRKGLTQSKLYMMLNRAGLSPTKIRKQQGATLLRAPSMKLKQT